MRAAGADALTPLKSANEYLPVSVPNTKSLYLVELGISECGATGLTAAPELPNIQAPKPPTRKKIMSATVATAKLRSARCDRSGRPPRCLAFIYSSHLGPDRR